jgi:hypothetical protein
MIRPNHSAFEPGESIWKPARGRAPGVRPRGNGLARPLERGRGPWPARVRLAYLALEDVGEDWHMKMRSWRVNVGDEYMHSALCDGGVDAPRDITTREAIEEQRKVGKGCENQH